MLYNSMCTYKLKNGKFLKWMDAMGSKYIKSMRISEYLTTN